MSSIRVVAVTRHFQDPKVSAVTIVVRALRGLATAVSTAGLAVDHRKTPSKGVSTHQETKSMRGTKVVLLFSNTRLAESLMALHVPAVDMLGILNLSGCFISCRHRKEG